MNKGKDIVLKKVALYLRVSTDDQGDKFGLDAQKRALQSFIESRSEAYGGYKYELAGEEYIYVDDGASGTTPPEERPAFSKMMQDIKFADPNNPPFDVVAVYKIDRFARRLRILLDIIDFFENLNIEFLSIHESIDTSNAFGRAILGIIGVIAELEMENIRERTQAGRESAILSGIFMGGKAPYGYIKNDKKKLEVYKEEEDIVKTIFRKYVVENKSVTQISKYLKEHNVLTPEASLEKRTGGERKSKRKNDETFWRDSTIRRILKNETYIGKYYYNRSHKGVKLSKEEWKLIEHHHPPIIEEKIFYLAQERLNNISRQYAVTKKKRKNHLYLLSGLVKCKSCYNPLKDSQPNAMIGDRKKLKKTSPTPQYSYYYKCRRKQEDKTSDPCTVLPINAEALEKYVTKIALEILNNPEVIYSKYQDSNEINTKIDELKKRRETLDEKIRNASIFRKNILRQNEKGYINDQELEKRLSEIEEETKDAERKHALLENNLGELVLKEATLQSFEDVKEKYLKLLNVMEKKENRVVLFDLLHDMIESIDIYSRPIDEADCVSGRKKKNQRIPHRMEIKFKVDQQLLQIHFLKSIKRYRERKDPGTEFGVKEHIW